MGGPSKDSLIRTDLARVSRVKPRPRRRSAEAPSAVRSVAPCWTYGPRLPAPTNLDVSTVFRRQGRGTCHRVPGTEGGNPAPVGRSCVAVACVAGSAGPVSRTPDPARPAGAGVACWRPLFDKLRTNGNLTSRPDPLAQGAVLTVRPELVALVERRRAGVRHICLARPGMAGGRRSRTISCHDQRWRLPQ